MARQFTNVGSRPAAFGPSEWALTLAVGVIWGSAYLWIAIGVDSLSPGIVAFGRVALGAIVLAALPQARRRIAKADWLMIGVLAVVGNAGPAWLFAQAETEIDSAVAGMITAGTPILTLVVASLLLRRVPGRAQVGGIAVGFVGIMMMTAPSLVGVEATPLGVGLVFIATIGYALNANLVVPLQQRYGGPAVILWALIVSSVLLLPFAVGGAADSTFTWQAIVAVVILGAIGTGLVRVLAATLAGRVGGPRMATTNYLGPIVAIVLGVTFRGETIAPLAIMGVVVVLLGAFWTTRAVKPNSDDPPRNIAAKPSTTTSEY